VDRQRELVSFEEDFLDVNEAKKMADVALDILVRRRIVKVKGGLVVINPSRRPYLLYYANSLNHLLD
jgi:hypothetical protein